MSLKKSCKEFKQILRDFYEKPYLFVKNRRVRFNKVISVEEIDHTVCSLKGSLSHPLHLTFSTRALKVMKIWRIC